MVVETGFERTRVLTDCSIEFHLSEVSTAASLFSSSFFLAFILFCTRLTRLGGLGVECIEEGGRRGAGVGKKDRQKGRRTKGSRDSASMAAAGSGRHAEYICVAKKGANNCTHLGAILVPETAGLSPCCVVGGGGGGVARKIAALQGRRASCRVARPLVRPRREGALLPFPVDILG